MKLKGLSRGQLSEALDVSTGFFSSYMAGEEMYVSDAIKLANILEVSLSDLLGLPDEG